MTIYLEQDLLILDNPGKELKDWYGHEQRHVLNIRKALRKEVKVYEGQYMGCYNEKEAEKILKDLKTEFSKSIEKGYQAGLGHEEKHAEPKDGKPYPVIGVMPKEPEL